MVSHKFRTRLKFTWNIKTSKVMLTSNSSLTGKERSILAIWKISNELRPLSWEITPTMTLVKHGWFNMIKKTSGPCRNLFILLKERVLKFQLISMAISIEITFLWRWAEIICSSVTCFRGLSLFNPSLRLISCWRLKAWKSETMSLTWELQLASMNELISQFIEEFIGRTTLF